MQDRKEVEISYYDYFPVIVSRRRGNVSEDEALSYDQNGKWALLISLNTTVYL